MDKRYWRYMIIFKIIILLVLTGTACKKNNLSPLDTIVETRGNIINSSPVGTYSVNDIKQFGTIFGLAGKFTFSYSVRVIRIIYSTIDSQQKDISVSGVIMVPVDGENLPILSLQHGTETKRENVASVDLFHSYEGIAGLFTASMGYVTCIPDYPGLGVSDILHPYIHAKSLSTAVIDFIRASKTYCSENKIILNNQLFLTGYSEGGYVTLATQKDIEQNYAAELKVTAVSPMAGPYDLAGTTRSFFKQTTYKYPAYLAYFLTAYNDIYKWNRLNDIFKTPYGDKMTGLFDGTKGFSTINNELPNNITNLIRPHLINSYFNGTATFLSTAIQENTLLDWTPTAPLRFYHGDSDETVPYQNALTVIENLKQNGAASIELITIKGGTHESSALPAALDALEWFNEFRTTYLANHALHNVN